MSTNRDCNTCKYKEELNKSSQERDINCQQCHAAQRTTGHPTPNWEPAVLEWEPEEDESLS